MTATRLLLAGLMAAATAPAFAVLSYDQNVTTNVIFGSGNGNGAWTVDRNNGVEIGLRAKVRYPIPAGVYNSNGDGSYTHLAGDATGGGRAFWNFEWSVNSNYDGTNTGNATGGNLNGLTYQLSLDYDSGAGVTDFHTWNPINPTLGAFQSAGFAIDNSFGDNGTAQSAGTEAPGAMSPGVPTPGAVADYNNLVATSNMVQNSGNMGFFDNIGVPPFSPILVDGNGSATAKAFDFAASGEYTITLTAFDAMSNEVASSSITVVAVPEPTAVLFGSLLAGGLGLTVARRRREED